MTAVLSGAGNLERIRETRRESVPGGSRAASTRRDGLPNPFPTPDTAADLQLANPSC